MTLRPTWSWHRGPGRRLRDGARAIVAAALGPRLDRWLLADAPPVLAPADCLLVPGALVEPDGSASDSLARRVGHAAALYRRGLGRALVLTGGPRGGAPPEAEVAARLAAAAGVPAAVLLLEPRSRTTRENLRYARPLMAAAGLASCLVVTDAFHMTRCLVIARDLGLDARPAPVPDGPLDADPAARRRLLVHEAFSLARYRLDGLLGRRR